MNLNKELIENVFQKLNYELSDVNIIGIRSLMDVPDVFNDLIILYIPDLDVFNVFEATTDPGLYYMNNPMNVKGTGILKSGQYKKCYKIGFHGSNKLTIHSALVQVNNVTVYRDINRDSKKDYLLTDTGLFGCNIHTTGSIFCGIPLKIGKWSASCQVVRDNRKFQTDFIDILKKNFDINKLYNYTLLTEKELLP